MFPNSPSLGRSPPLPAHLLQTGEPLTPERLLHANISRMLMSGNALPLSAFSAPPMLYGSRNSLASPSSSSPFQNRKRRSDQDNGQYDMKRQRFHSPQHPSHIIHQAVPLRDDLRHHFPGSVGLPLRQAPPSQELNGQVSSPGDAWLFDHIDTTLPVAQDKLSQQILDLFLACQQQLSDLKKKELCRVELQKEIQQIFPQSRLYLVGSSLNGFGTRGSDGDLCLVLKEEPINQKTEARHILSLLQKHFCTRLGYVERPQLIRAKVPIVKFRDRVSGAEFDLNVNNVVGIRNTFLLRTYAHVESRVRPLVLVVKRWAGHRDINDASRGTLSSYSLVLMVLHYLQTLPEPVLPSLQKDYPECFNPSMQLQLVHLAPRNVPRYHSKNRKSLGDLLLGFFEYFAKEFDWTNKLISVREGIAMQRTEDLEWRNKYICVEEPFDRTNTARAVHEKMKFDMIQDEFMKAWILLRDNKDLNSVLPVGKTTVCMPKR